jgi:hypothetical protein
MFNRFLIYIAHQIKPHAPANALRAAQYLRAFNEAGHLAIAPYIVPLASGWEDDNDPEQRERALKRCEDIAEHCDWVALCGPMVTEGMRREATACDAWVNLTGLSPEKAAQWVTDQGKVINVQSGSFVDVASLRGPFDSEGGDNG